MKFTLSWLKEHLESDSTLDQIVETLTRIGLEVEGVENPDVLQNVRNLTLSKVRVNGRLRNEAISK